jgi:hypothetical protein
VVYVGPDTKANALRYFGQHHLILEDWAKNGFECEGLQYEIGMFFMADMKAQWQMAASGGSSYTTTHFCVHCPATKQTNGHLRDACEDCRTRRCRNWPMIRQNWEELVVDWKVPEYPSNSSKLLVWHAFLESAGMPTKGKPLATAEQQGLLLLLEWRVHYTGADAASANTVINAPLQDVVWELALRFSAPELEQRLAELAPPAPLEPDSTDEAPEPLATQDRAAAMRSILPLVLSIEEMLAVLNTRSGSADRRMIKDTLLILLDLLHLELRVGEQILARVINMAFRGQGTDAS